MVALSPGVSDWRAGCGEAASGRARAKACAERARSLRATSALTPFFPTTSRSSLFPFLSFTQADDLADVQARLAARGIPTAREAVTEAGLVVTQLFFHDPDRNMIEVCDCHALPTVAMDGTVLLGAAACGLPKKGEVEQHHRPCSAAAAAVVAGASPPGAGLRVRCGGPDAAPAPSPMAGLTPHLPLTAGPAVIAAARARAGEAGCCGCAEAGTGGWCEEHSGGGGRAGDDTPGGGDSAGTECEMLMDGGSGSGGESSRGGGRGGAGSGSE